MVSDNLDRLERQVALDKEELNALINQIRDGSYNGSFQNDQVINNRIRNIQDNLYYLEAQLDIARREYESRNPVSTPVPNSVPNHFANNPTEQPMPNPVQPAVPNPFANNPTEPSAAPAPATVFSSGPKPSMTINTPTNVYQYNPASSKELSIFERKNGPVRSEYGEPKKSSFTEEIFGKNVMAVAASGLIFISLILFAIVFVPALGTAAKVFMMFAISFAFLIAGVIKLEKGGRSGRGNFFEALSGCGMGAVFVSLFVSNVHFKVLDDLPLYIFLLVWAVAALYLSKRYDSRMYSVIGQIGITISVIFGCLLFTESDHFRDFNSKFIILLIYFLIGSFAYLYFENKTERGNLLCHIFHIFNLIIIISVLYNMMMRNNQVMLMDFVHDRISDTVVYISLLLLAADVIFMLVTCFMGWDKAESLSGKHICGIAYTIILLSLISLFAVQSTWEYDSDIVFYTRVGGLFSILAIVLMTILEYRLKDKKDQWDKSPYWLWSLLLGAVLCYGLEKIPGSFNIIGIVLAVAAFIVYGYISDKEVYRVMGYISYVVYLFVHFGEYYILDTILSIVIILGAFYIMYSRRNYDMSKKVILYLLLILGILVKHYQIMDNIQLYGIMNNTGERFFVLFFSLACINTAATLTAFRKNWLTGEEESWFKDMLLCLNAVLIFTGMVLLYAYTSRIIWAVTVLILIALCCINVNRSEFFFHDYKHVYSGVKFTILMYVILDSASATQAAISIACFIIAIICITIGFHKRISNLRMYGLVLSMICVVKLVMFDIAYDNTLGHAISFFISGILCFVISAIYNYVGKRMND